MAKRTYLITLRTVHHKPQLEDELSRELLVKTLKVLECEGQFQVDAFAIRPRFFRLLVTGCKAGREIAKQCARVSERIIGLARYHRFGRMRIWDAVYECRRIDCADEVRGLRAMIEADSARLRGSLFPYRAYSSSGERWMKLSS